MSKELEELKRKLKTKGKIHQKEKGFGEYGRIYAHTNENLKDYIPKMEGANVLSVSASGDQKLNILANGAYKIDTFDINKNSLLLQNLKLNSIKYLDDKLAIEFLEKLNKENYFKFNDKLNLKEKEFFDFLYSFKNLNEVWDLVFRIDYLNNIINNNYFDENKIEYMKTRINKLESNHYCTHLYQLTNFLTTYYDYIFLSNISHYLECNTFLHYLKYLENYLCTNGAIYYAYLYNESPNNVVDAIKLIGDSYKDFDNDIFCDIIEKTDMIKVRSAEKVGKQDTILIYKRR